MTISLRQERIKESDEVRPGVIADFGYDGGIVRFEILDASKAGWRRPFFPGSASAHPVPRVRYNGK
jgi:Protein of unknown function (DUF2283)